MVGPYVLGRVLGAGATSKVKLGTHKETGQTVAVKIVSKEWIKSKPNLARKIERCARGRGGTGARAHAPRLTRALRGSRAELLASAARSR